MVTSEFVKKREAALAVGLSPHTLKKYRQTGVLVEAIHYQRIGSRTVLYNLPLLLDRIRNWNDEQAHQRAVETYLHSLPSNQPKRGRKAG
ncbi:hypothetical protein DO97_16165 [Neosynechococcus sphagnicola sy1]|uniref:HTH merR-type domain-containing protein n=2 Tax=Neosynechococcus TaxID=1501143 RepID=A0A098TGJ5_9CYAN|nr:hypothetical protein DO97_16165 [Neosynechococcus sphagnicola sy1]